MGSKDINDKGRIIETFIDNHGLCLYNTKTPTYLHPATGTYTSLDLSICFPTLLLDYDWKVYDDLCGSDHFPVLLNNIGPDLDGGGRVVRWCWVNFQCRGVLLIWIIVGQGPIALAVGAGGGCLDIFSLSILSLPILSLLPGRVAQSVGHLTRKSGVLGSIPGRATYFRFSFRFFKKGSCQLLAKVCARSTG